MKAGDGGNGGDSGGDDSPGGNGGNGGAAKGGGLYSLEGSANIDSSTVQFNCLIGGNGGNGGAGDNTDSNSDPHGTGGNGGYALAVAPMWMIII